MAGIPKFFAISMFASNSMAVPSPEKSVPSTNTKSFFSSKALYFSIILSNISPSLPSFLLLINSVLVKAKASSVSISN